MEDKCQHPRLPALGDEVIEREEFQDMAMCVGGMKAGYKQIYPSCLRSWLLSSLLTIQWDLVINISLETLIFMLMYSSWHFNLLFCVTEYLLYLEYDLSAFWFLMISFQTGSKSSTCILPEALLKTKHTKIYLLFLCTCFWLRDTEPVEVDLCAWFCSVFLYTKPGQH